MQFYVYPNNNVVIIYLYKKIRQTLYHVPSAYKNNRGLYPNNFSRKEEKNAQCTIQFQQHFNASSKIF